GAVPLGGFPISFPPTLDVTAGAVNSNGTPGATSYRITLDNDVFNTNSPAVLYNGSLRLSVGNAVLGNTSTPVSASTVQVSRISGVNDVSVSVGNDFNTINGPQSTIKLDTITARSINYSVGTNSSDVELTNSTVAGPVLITVDDQYNNVLVNNVLVSLTP